MVSIEEWPIILQSGGTAGREGCDGGDSGNRPLRAAGGDAAATRSSQRISHRRSAGRWMSWSEKTSAITNMPLQ